MKCYKVIMVKYNTGTGRPKMVSVGVIGKYELEYRINQKTEPLIGKIFVFKDVEFAKMFSKDLNGRSEEHILECECGELKEAQYACPMMNDGYLEQWWAFIDENGRSLMNPMLVPPGTYFTNWVIPIKVVR